MSSMQLHVLSQVSRENFSPFRITTFSRQLVPERASCSLSTDTQRRRRKRKKKNLTLLFILSGGAVLMKYFRSKFCPFSHAGHG